MIIIYHTICPHLAENSRLFKSFKAYCINYWQIFAAALLRLVSSRGKKIFESIFISFLEDSWLISMVEQSCHIL